MTVEMIERCGPSLSIGQRDAFLDQRAVFPKRGFRDWLALKRDLPPEQRSHAGAPATLEIPSAQNHSPLIRPGQGQLHVEQMVEEKALRLLAIQDYLLEIGSKKGQPEDALGVRIVGAVLST